MAVHIRLKRFGGKNKVYWRIVVADSRSPRDGKFIEEIGHYESRSNPAKAVINIERLKHWVSNGAKMSDTVRSLVKKQKAK